VSPRLVDSKGNIYGVRPETIRKFSGSSYRLLATAEGQSNPSIDLMWGVYAARLAVRLPAGHEPVRHLRDPGGRSAGERARSGRPRQALGRAGHLGAAPGLCEGAARVGTCEGWFVGDHSITGGQSATTPILHVEVDVELAVSLLQAFGLIGQTAVEATSITLAAADFGKSTMAVSAPAYDEQNDRLLLTAEFDEGPRQLISCSKDDGIVWSRPINSQESLPDQARFTGGKIYTFADGTAYIRDATDGALISSHGSFAAGVGISGRMLFDESATTFYMTGTSAVHQVIAHRAIPGAMPLADIVSALSLRTGLTEADLDVAELTDGVRGYALARQVSVRGALELLAAAYSFDAVESDHQLKFKKRGRSPSRVVPEQDLVPVNASTRRSSRPAPRRSTCRSASPWSTRTSSATPTSARSTPSGWRGRAARCTRATRRPSICPSCSPQRRPRASRSGSCTAPGSSAPATSGACPGPMSTSSPRTWCR
jgi:Putative phage tail protein